MTVPPVTDRRAFFVGDSFVLGVGDPAHRGWVGRLAERSDRDGTPVTAYNLGVRMDTSDDVRRRWAAEVAVRRHAGSEERLVLSFGVNDTTAEHGTPRVDPGRTVVNLHVVVDEATAAGLPVLVVGPPPVTDRVQNRRIDALDARLRTAAAERDLPYVPVFAALTTYPPWAGELERGDGAHPAAAGYARLTELVWPAWRRWLRGR